MFGITVISIINVNPSLLSSPLTQSSEVLTIALEVAGDVNMWD